MSFHYSPKAVTANLKLCIDPANPRSYPAAGTSAYDLAKVTDQHSLIGPISWSSSNQGVFTIPDPASNRTARIESASYLNMNSSELTVDAWFKRTKSNGFYNIVWGSWLPYLSFSSQNRFYLSWRINNVVSGDPALNGQKLLESANTYSNNVWYNVCCTIRNDESQNVSVAKIYVDGVLENTSPVYNGIAAFVPTSDVRFMIGNWVYDTQNWVFEGSISCIKWYDRILSDAEILQNYNALRTRFI
jgi:hypothetical protein